MNDEHSPAFEWKLADAAARLEAIASAIDALPGEEGHGLTQLGRIQILALLEYQTTMHWCVAQQLRVAGSLTLGQAVTAHHRISIAFVPTESQIMATLGTLSNSSRAIELPSLPDEDNRQHDVRPQLKRLA